MYKFEVIYAFCCTDFLPQEVTTFYDGLTAEEKAIIKEIAANHAKYETEEQVRHCFKYLASKTLICLGT